MLTYNTLKFMAIISMTLDHIANYLLENEALKIAFHICARITMPLMCYFIFLGFTHTKNLKNYITRMGIFTLIGHFAFCFVNSISYIPFKEGFFYQTSIMLPLLLSIFCLMVESSNMKKGVKILCFAFFFILALPADYMFLPILITLFMYKYRESVDKQMIMLAVINTLYSIYIFMYVDVKFGLIQFFAVISCLLIKLCNKEHVKNKLVQYLYYIYYPLHLVIIKIMSFM